MSINNEAELEELLSRPGEQEIAAMKALDGDLLILGCGGKMGPSLARLARRSVEAAGVRKRIIAVARFSSPRVRGELDTAGIETIAADLLEPEALAALPDIPNIIFMAARKFGTTGAEHLTWAMNTMLPGLVAERFRASRIAAFSTGNIYGLRPAVWGGATESCALAPEGEYAQSALGRERMFEYGSSRWQTPVTLLRLNYAVDLRLQAGAGRFADGAGERDLAGGRQLDGVAQPRPLPVAAAGSKHHRTGNVVGPRGGKAIRRAVR